VVAVSNEAISWCVKLHPGPGPKAVLFCLADRATDHSGEDWTCFPSVADIVKFTDYSRATVERHLRGLWREGYISRKRRRRADGRLGIFDYTLHREADLRAALKAARSAVEDVDAAMETGDAPPLKMSAGEGADPALNLDGASAQFDVQPALKLSAQEPSENPQGNPHSGRAREPGSEGWEAALAAWPDSGAKRTDWPAGQAQWARCCGLETPARLMAAIAAAATDPDLAKGDYGYPGLHTWLAQERWRHFLPRAETLAVDVRTPFAGPPEVAAALLAVGGVETWLLGATWREADRTILTRNGIGAERLVDQVGRRRLAELDLRVERAGSAQGA
jgi:DNA-binding MarR family transcriptional regulator